MLPKIVNDHLNELKQNLSNPKEVLQNNKGKILIGVVNIKTGKIHLLPCIKDKVWLEIDDTGEYVRGWKLTKSLKSSIEKGAALTEEELEKYKNTFYPPRVLSYDFDTKKESLRTHTFILDCLGELENKNDYRGFSIVPGDSIEENKYVWDSNSLNMQPKSLHLSKEMSSDHQKLVLDGVKNLQSESETLSTLLKLCQNYQKLLDKKEDKYTHIEDLLRILSDKNKTEDTKIGEFLIEFNKKKNVIIEDNHKFGVLFCKLVVTLLKHGYEAAIKLRNMSKNEMKIVEQIESEATSTRLSY